MNYGYVNASEQAVKSELRHRLEAYLETKELMKQCKNLSLFIALKHFKDSIRMAE
jgi:GTP-binding protein EngB required for normal cell division